MNADPAAFLENDGSNARPEATAGEWRCRRDAGVAFRGAATPTFPVLRSRNARRDDKIRYRWVMGWHFNYTNGRTKC